MYLEGFGSCDTVVHSNCGNLILGGVIATVGDRIGTRVGRRASACLSFGPNTAVVVTILTGSIISASTLAILFATSEQLRIGVFELENIQRNLRHRRQDLQTTVSRSNNYPER